MRQRYSRVEWTYEESGEAEEYVEEEREQIIDGKQEKAVRMFKLL
jgi:hypothetical protein